MVCLSTKPAPVYRPRLPRQSPLYQTIARHLPEFERTYDERYAPRYGPWRPIIGQVAAASSAAADSHYGFARVRCPDCHHEMFVSFSCHQCCLCPLLPSETHPAGRRDDRPHHLCRRAPPPARLHHPKRLRLFCRYDRTLLGQLARAAWRATVEVSQQVLGRKDLKPGMIAGTRPSAS